MLKKLLIVAGVFWVLCCAIAFTAWPFWGYHWLGTSMAEMNAEPQTIILLGGSGMPSESNLMRSWYTAYAAKQFPKAKILIAMPGDTTDSLSTPCLMKKELNVRGVRNPIGYEPLATNTRGQALNCSYLIPKRSSILLITSPEHTRRAVLCFQKVGFENVNALPAFENATEADVLFDDDALGGNTTLVPDVGNNTNIRYQFWNHLKYEIMIAREIVALSYYKLRGWI